MSRLKEGMDAKRMDAKRVCCAWKNKALYVRTVWFGNCGQEHVYLTSVWMRRVDGWVELCVVLILFTHQMAPVGGAGRETTTLPATFIYLYHAGT